VASAIYLWSCLLKGNIKLFFYYYYWYSALGPVWEETRAQSGDWYSSGMLHPGQLLRGSLPLLSPYSFIPTKISESFPVSPWCLQTNAEIVP